jgi:hypothetical protein
MERRRTSGHFFEGTLCGFFSPILRNVCSPVWLPTENRKHTGILVNGGGKPRRHYLSPDTCVEWWGLMTPAHLALSAEARRVLKEQGCTW